MSLIKHKPQLSVDGARQISDQHFGIDSDKIEILPGERDQNFKLTTVSGDCYVLKIANGREEPVLLDAQNAMLKHLAERVDFCPSIIPTKTGLDTAQVIVDDSSHIVRMLEFVEGVPLASISYRDSELMEDLGRRVGQMRQALADFDHSALHRNFYWDLARARQMITDKLDLIDDSELKKTIQYFVAEFDRHTSPLLAALPKSVIHNDANDGNVIIANNRVAGIVDLGDAVYSWSIGEAAIAIAYSILNQADPMSLAARMIAACCHESPLTEIEIDALYGLICIRLCVSAVIAAEQQQKRPDDPYLSISQEPIRRILPQLKKIPHKIAQTTFRLAAGFEPKGGGVAKWLAQKKGDFIFPVVTDNPKHTFALLDCSVSSTLLPNGAQTVSVSELTRILFEEMERLDANIGVGRYLEPRILYSSDQFGTSDDLATEKRTIHLGIDLFAEAGAAVVAPLAGEVECVVEIDLPLDYGTLVLLRHEPAADICFFTLYGHLARKTAQQVSVGQKIAAGETIGWLGDENENGGWPPHLHFQIMLDLLEFENDFPGVCLASQKQAWAAICPDPNLILNLPAELGLEQGPTKSQTLVERQKRLGPSLSLGYDDPLKIVRGRQHWLFDETGRKFLDAYNNVPHVGHCHPTVVRALADGARLLNTNTRYLSDPINSFAERLSATMPESLDVCYFLNSASEANELALRLARNYTGEQDLIVLNAAYHGHTTTLIDISPYKHSGPGGAGSPGWVHTVPLADTYRGRFKDRSTAGKQYATAVGKTIEKLASIGGGLCGFIAESCPSVAGQIIFPDGYLANVYSMVRSAGGVCIADEVQTGYGRLGSAFYGFELQKVVPDIVVLGKPIGNGHPLAAVVTTAPIANAFDNGMEFFSTFGGNTVSCLVGLAVLDVVQNEGLQQQAQTTGEFLLNELNNLKLKHGLIGDVRGSGLFLGVELVRDHETLEPAAEEASFIVNRMRDRGILIGTDGPLHNVIKIRPPMTFGLNEASLLIDALDQCLELAEGQPDIFAKSV